MMQIKSLASGSSGNCYFVSDGNSSLLLEAGIKFSEIRKRLSFKLSQVAGCLISHSHLDHSKSASAIMKAGIDIYASQGTVETLKLSGHRVNIIKAKKQFTVGAWTILPFDTVHDAPEPLGFLVSNGKDKILFATDTCYIPYKFRGLTHILIEANYSLKILKQNHSLASAVKQKIMRSHLSIENAKKFLEANDLGKVQGIYLLHLSLSHSDAEVFRQEIQKLTGKEVYIC